MEPPPRPNRWDLAAWGSAAATLGVAHLLLVDSLARYGAWLLVFTIWMAWFVYYGVRWLYRPGRAD
jgi:uncharacterized membrane protein YphA (DoxX/SURF4 family)